MRWAGRATRKATQEIRAVFLFETREGKIYCAVFVARPAFGSNNGWICRRVPGCGFNWLVVGCRGGLL